MDRCIIDGIAFILEPLEQYYFDEGRVLKPEESLAIQGLITEAYKDYGYSLISVPFMSPEERVRFILEKVREFENSTNKSH